MKVSPICGQKSLLRFRSHKAAPAAAAAAAAAAVVVVVGGLGVPGGWLAQHGTINDTSLPHCSDV